ILVFPGELLNTELIKMTSHKYIELHQADLQKYYNNRLQRIEGSEISLDVVP
nr:hypothetical protein [Tanacetum cinerariifolium]